MDPLTFIMAMTWIVLWFINGCISVQILRNNGHTFNEEQRVMLILLGTLGLISAILSVTIFDKEGN